GEVDGAGVCVGVHGGDDDVAAAGTRAVLHVGQHRVDTGRVQKHESHGAGYEIVSGTEVGCVDVVDAGFDVGYLLPLDDCLQCVDGVRVGIDGSYIEAELAQIQRVAPVGTPHFKRFTRLDDLARLYNLAVGRIQAVAAVQIRRLHCI